MLTLAGGEKIVRAYKQNFINPGGQVTLSGVFTRENVNPLARVILARSSGNPDIHVTSQVYLFTTVCNKTNRLDLRFLISPLNSNIDLYNTLFRFCFLVVQ